MFKLLVWLISNTNVVSFSCIFLAKYILLIYFKVLVLFIGSMYLAKGVDQLNKNNLAKYNGSKIKETITIDLKSFRIKFLLNRNDTKSKQRRFKTLKLFNIVSLNQLLKFFKQKNVSDVITSFLLMLYSLFKLNTVTI